jgi:hypothetical protein
MLRFETDSKYYAIDLIHDLLGDLVVVCHYGGLHSNLSHNRNYFVADKGEAMCLMQKIAKVRYRHGCDIVEDQQGWLN